MGGFPLVETARAVLVIATAIALSVIVIGLAWSYERLRSRLPAATRLDDLNQRVAAREEELQEKAARSRDLDQLIQSRDRHAAEAAELRERVENMRAELAGLEPAREQIEAVKRQAAEAAEAFAASRSDLDELRKERMEAEATLRDAGDRLRLIEQQASIAEERAGAASARIEELRRDLQALEADRVSLVEEMAGLRRQKDAADGDLRNNAAALFAAREEVAALAMRKAFLDKDIRDTQAGIDAVAKAKPHDAEAMKADLLLRPSCLEPEWSSTRPPRSEQEALRDLESHLRDRGLHYHTRTVHAFHTALKVNDVAQLAVLAGVSGTGKSLLPRHYAEAMGMRFLPIAVEPRWDSPQDLLGFYNYIEQRYRATDLARALVRMDPYDTAGLSPQGQSDEMLIVLLDEMNLARVEYYFSEFLSRLEVRPPYHDAGSETRRKMASLPIDIPGRDTILLFPSHNVLFVGTMNDDESTQSLSDKVLDRSNVLQFPAPRRLARAKPVSKAGSTSQGCNFNTWRTWVSTTDSLAASDRGAAERIINALAEIMGEMGRPFGHRLSDAMLAYTANYPVKTVETALADQIEMRILPKLRGVPIDQQRGQFDKLQELVGTQLRDADLAEHLGELVSKQADGIGQFNWRGLTR